MCLGFETATGGWWERIYPLSYSNPFICISPFPSKMLPKLYALFILLYAMFSVQSKVFTLFELLTDRVSVCSFN